jgi:hypothetical protein
MEDQVVQRRGLVIVRPSEVVSQLALSVCHYVLSAQQVSHRRWFVKPILTPPQQLYHHGPHVLSVYRILLLGQALVEN